MTDPVVSILVVTWKRIDLLEECLKSIAAAKPAVPFELIVVNNGGAKTAARVDAVAAGARVVHSSVNLGLPGGLHLARSFARGKYLATLQDDVLVEEGWLDRLVARMDEDPWVGIVGSSVDLPGGHRICGLYLLGGLTWLHPSADGAPVPVDLCTSASMLSASATASRPLRARPTTSKRPSPSRTVRTTSRNERSSSARITLTGSTPTQAQASADPGDRGPASGGVCAGSDQGAIRRASNHRHDRPAAKSNVRHRRSTDRHTAPQFGSNHLHQLPVVIQHWHGEQSWLWHR